MKKLDKLTVTWSGLLPSMVKLLESWEPPKLKGETNYRDHLLNEMRASIPSDCKVEKEYRHRGTTIDIWVKWQGVISSDEVSFELKINLTRKTDFDRLVGQIEGMEPSRNKTVVVLIGETDPALLGRLRERYAKYIQDDLNQTMAIVCVPISS